MSEVERLALKAIYTELDDMITKLQNDIRHKAPPSVSTVSILRSLLPEGYENSFPKKDRK